MVRAATITSLLESPVHDDDGADVGAVANVCRRCLMGSPNQYQIVVRLVLCGPVSELCKYGAPKRPVLIVCAQPPGEPPGSRWVSPHRTLCGTHLSGPDGLR